MSAVQKRKLIEVALPLEVINRESEHEKSVPRRGHPATLHLWWARRPLAAARGVLFAQLVDDPSSHPDKFPTEEDQRAERERLHSIIERLVVWENIGDEQLLSEARREILLSCDGNPPPIMDPFAGGGSIPLEAQRLGLEAHASDLNPVAVLINKALIEIPPKFRDQAPVYPGLAGSQLGEWKGSSGLAADVRAYGGWLRDEAERQIGHVYPKALLADGSQATVIAWIWARTVTCPNPACGIEMPLAKSWWLGKKKGREAHVVPTVVGDSSHGSGLRVKFSIGHNSQGPATAPTMAGRQGARCLACEATISKDYIKAEGLAGRMGAALMAVVAEGQRRRVYLDPTKAHEDAARVERPMDTPEEELAFDPRNLWTPQYGLAKFSDLFTVRQLLALTTLSDLVADVHTRVMKDALEAGRIEGDRLEEDGRDALAYADSVSTYLVFALSKLADWSSSICGWIPIIEGVTHTFSKQSIPMTWDYAEINPFSSSVGNFGSHVEWVARSVDMAPQPKRDQSGFVLQEDARVVDMAGFLISTDPPYYANIDYADLADYFYVWIRRSLRDTFPSLLSTLTTPKAQELVANPYRNDGVEGAKSYFERGFREVFERARLHALEDFPITVYYAYKQTQKDASGEVSTGWETLLDGMIRAGWAITATWPVRSERAARSIGQGTNALASSIVLALRPRPDDAPTTDRRGFIAALQAELPNALRNLQLGAIAPVDLPQAAIGPGMAIFSRYASLIEADGSLMTVRAALARINEILDQVLNAQEGDFDPTTRFAIAWYRQHGYDTGKFGDANNIANARNTSVEVMDRDGILVSRAGKVTLQKPADLPSAYDVLTDYHTSAWEAAHHLIRVLESEGVALAGDFLKAATSRTDGAVEADLVKELAFLLFSLAEKNGWTRDALSFNNLATSWPEIVESARTSRGSAGQQGALDFDDEEN
jgi:putative DNA methylase